MKKVIGIDLGGTNVRVAKVSEDGQILQEFKSPSYASEGPERINQIMIDLIKKIDNWQECVGIGIGVPGPVDTINNVMTMSTNLPGSAGYPFAANLAKEFNLPTYLGNDANVAGLAEALVGAGKDLPIVYYTTISTGIGGGLIVDGKVVSGKNGYAGEIANIIVDRMGTKYNHLNIGAVENLASGTAITRRGKEVFEGPIKDASDVFALARQNDPLAIQICDEVAYDLAMMFSIMAHVCEPFAFVIGGGVMKSKDCFFDKMVEDFKSLVHPPMANIEFLEAKLSEPGIVGAAMLPLSQGH